MNKKLYWIAAGLLIISLFAIGYVQISKPGVPNFQHIQEGFEDGLGGWVRDSDVPEDPNNPGHAVAWNIEPVTSQAHTGQYSVKFFIDGLMDDGTIWIEKKIDVRKNSQIQVSLSFWFYSDEESWNTIAAVVGFIGFENPEKPLTEGQFEVLGPANMIAGWKQYNHTKTLSTGNNTEALVALGISVRWETPMTYYIDDVDITVK